MTIDLIKYHDYDIIVNSNNGKFFALKNTFRLTDEPLRNFNKASFVNSYEKIMRESLTKLYDDLASDIDKNETSKQLDLIIVNITNKCNLNCKYCYTSSKSNSEILNAKNAIDAIEKLLKIYKRDSVHVLFQGGEPLLAIDEITSIATHFQGQAITYSIQTNGTLLSDRIIDICKKYNIRISVSLDGFSLKQNELRGKNKAYKLIIDGIQRLKKHQLNFGVITVITKSNVEKINEVVTEYVINEIPHFKLNFFYPIGRGKQIQNEIIPNDKLIGQMKLLFSTMLEKRVITGDFMSLAETNLMLLWQKIFYRKLDNYMCGSVPCGAGVRTFTVNTDGYIYPCTYYLPNVIENDSFKIVNIADEDFANKLKKREIINDKNAEDCKGCSLLVYCGGGGCRGAIHNMNPKNKKGIYCEYYKEMIKFMITETMRQFKQDVVKNF